MVAMAAVPATVAAAAAAAAVCAWSRCITCAVVWHFTSTPATLPYRLHVATLQGLLKEKLELEAVRSKDGTKRVTIKRIEDELTFDKVHHLPPNSFAFGAYNVSSRHRLLQCMSQPAYSCSSMC